MSDDAFHREIGDDPVEPARRAHRLHRAVAVPRIRRPPAVPRRAVRDRGGARVPGVEGDRRARRRPGVRRGCRDHRVERRADRRGDPPPWRGRARRSSRQRDGAGARLAHAAPARARTTARREMGDRRLPHRRRRSRSASIASSGASSTPARGPTNRIPPRRPRRPPRCTPTGPSCDGPRSCRSTPGCGRTEDHDRMSALGASRDASGWLTGKFQDNVSARSITVDGRDYGYLRLWSFDLSDDDGFVAEVIDMLGELPAGRAHHRPAREPGRADLGRRAAAAAVHAVADLADTVLDHRVRPDAGDDRRAAEPARARPVAAHPARGDRHRRGLLAVGHDHAVRAVQRHRPGVRRSGRRRRRSDHVLGGRPVRRRVRRQRPRHRRQRRPGDRCRRRQRVAGRHAQQRAGRDAAQPAQAAQGRRVHDVGPSRHADRRLRRRPDRGRRHRRSPRRTR